MDKNTCPRRQQRQRGSAAVTLMLSLLALVTMIGLIEVGYLYWAKRDVQKIADLAALAGAQRLELCSSDLADNSAARGNAVRDNGFPGGLDIRCGHWSPGSGPDAVVGVSGTNVLNAVQVDASRAAVPLFGQIGSMPMLRARAIARSSEPMAAFSIGSRLIDINADAPLQGVLRLVGLDLSNTELASFRGLAQVRVTPRGLLQALGIPVDADLSVGELNALLSARKVSVGELLGAVASVGSAQGVANVNVDLLRSRLASLGLEKLLVSLGSSAGSPGLFATIAGGTAAANSALDVDINAVSLVTTTLEIANSRHAVEIPSLNVLQGVIAKASVVEPASIAIGPVGTTAYNSQVRVFLDIDSNRIPLVGAALRLLGTRVQLPVYLDVVDGFGRLSRLDCGTLPRTGTVDVTSAIANVCIGTAVSPWDSTRELCATGMHNVEMVTLLGKTVLNHKIQLDALSSQDQLTLSPGQSQAVGPNMLAIGDLLANLTDSLLGTLQALLQPKGNAADNASELATRYLDATKNNLGRYQPDAVISALRDGHPDPELPALGTWTTDIPVCTTLILISTCTKKPGDVWTGFKTSTTISDPSLLGGLFDVLGLTACDGLLTGLLAYNTCVRNNLAGYLQTKPGGLQGNGSYSPVTGNGSCSSVLCTLLKPLIDVIRPLLNGVGGLLSNLLGNVLGINLGRSVVDMHSIQCGASELVR